MPHEDDQLRYKDPYICCLQIPTKTNIQNESEAPGKRYFMQIDQKKSRSSTLMLDKIILKTVKRDKEDKKLHNECDNPRRKI